MTQALKCHPKYFKDVKSGLKPFEVRKNDRDFAVGQKLLLQEYDPETEKYTGEEWEGSITYILDDPNYVKKGFVIFAIQETQF